VATQVLSALISGVAALVGALIGFLGAQRATKQTVDLTREQRRLERTQEMQAEVVPRFIAYLSNQKDALSFVLEHDTTQKVNLPEETQRQIQEFRRKVAEFTQYTRLHSIWLPDDLSREFTVLVEQYWHYAGILDEANRDWFNNPDKADRDEVRERRLQQVRDWFEGERRARETALRSAARDLLGVDE
jgi:hypothetical protein